jgi:hypothetical protein
VFVPTGGLKRENCFEMNIVRNERVTRSSTTGGNGRILSTFLLEIQTLESKLPSSLVLWTIGLFPSLTLGLRYHPGDPLSFWGVATWVA